MLDDWTENQEVELMSFIQISRKHLIKFPIADLLASYIVVR